MSLAKTQSDRWFQLFFALVAMMAISSPQYVWTLFVGPLAAATKSRVADVQITFSILVVLQTWAAPAQGWLIDRIGPRLLVALGGALSGLGWILAGRVDTLLGLYLTYGLFCGIGTGFVYIGTVGLMARWFPDRRGLACGVVAAGYGFGALATTFPIDSMIKAEGFRTTLLTFGLVLGGIGLCAGLLLRAPAREDVAVGAAPPSGVAPREMLRQPVFWLMFLMMTMMSTGGLMVVSNFKSFATDFGLAKATVLGGAAVPLALSIDRICNGLTRPFFGWVSDHIGREPTMALAFTLEAAAITLLILLRHDPLVFVLMSGVVFFGWGEIFSLFPSTLTDTFGARYATTNYGFLYMAQGVGSILGAPLAASLKDAIGSWVPVFAIVIILDLATAALAMLVLRPMRSRMDAGVIAEPELEVVPGHA